MRKRIRWTAEAKADVRRLDRQIAMQIFEALDRYARTDEGDVKQPKGQQKEFRLRIGDWRVRFTRDEANTMRILHVLHGSEAYR